MATAGYAGAIWIGVTSSPCPIGRFPIEEPEYSLQRLEDLSVFLAGQSDPGGSTEPESVDPVVEAVVPHQLADLDRADVARVGEDLARREVFFGVFGVVVDDPVGDLDLVGDVEAARGRDQPALEGPGDGYDLEGRAGFVVEGDGPVLERASAAAVRVGSLGFRPGPVGHREHRAVSGSITIAVASFGSNTRPTAPSTSSMRCWMLVSIVSWTALPGTAGWLVVIETG